MERFRVSAEMIEGNTELGPDQELRDGIECDGCLLILKGAENGTVESVYGMSIMDLARLINNRTSQTGNVLRQAMAIADGMRKAEAIAKERRPEGIDCLMDLIAKRAKE